MSPAREVQDASPGSGVVLSPLNESTDSNRSSINFSPIACHPKQGRPVIQTLLRQAVGSLGKPVFVHVPFTTSDLLNWKQSAGPSRDNPQGMHQLFASFMITHNPNWADVSFIKHCSDCRGKESGSGKSSGRGKAEVPLGGGRSIGTD